MISQRRVLVFGVGGLIVAMVTHQKLMLVSTLATLVLLNRIQIGMENGTKTPIFLVWAESFAMVTPFFAEIFL